MTKVTIIFEKKNYSRHEEDAVYTLKGLDGVKDFKLLRDMQWHPTASFTVFGNNPIIFDVISVLGKSAIIEIEEE